MGRVSPARQALRFKKMKLKSKPLLQGHSLDPRSPCARQTLSRRFANKASYFWVAQAVVVRNVDSCRMGSCLSVQAQVVCTYRLLCPSRVRGLDAHQTHGCRCCLVCLSALAFGIQTVARLLAQQTLNIYVFVHVNVVHRVWSHKGSRQSTFCARVMFLLC